MVLFWGIKQSSLSICLIFICQPLASVVHTQFSLFDGQKEDRYHHICIFGINPAKTKETYPDADLRRVPKTKLYATEGHILVKFKHPAIIDCWVVTLTLRQSYFGGRDFKSDTFGISNQGQCCEICGRNTRGLIGSSKLKRSLWKICGISSSAENFGLRASGLLKNKSLVNMPMNCLA